MFVLVEPVLCQVDIEQPDQIALGLVQADQRGFLLTSYNYSSGLIPDLALIPIYTGPVRTYSGPPLSSRDTD